MVTALGQHGALVAKVVQPVTKSERGTATTHGLQMVGKTVQSWDHRVKLSCAGHGLHVMVRSVVHCLIGLFLPKSDLLLADDRSGLKKIRKSSRYRKKQQQQ